MEQMIMNTNSKKPQKFPKYPWDVDDKPERCLRCKKYNFLDRFGTGPLICKEYLQGISHNKIINAERCDFFEENDELRNQTGERFQIVFETLDKLLTIEEKPKRKIGF